MARGQSAGTESEPTLTKPKQTHRADLNPLARSFSSGPGAAPSSYAKPGLKLAGLARVAETTPTRAAASTTTALCAE
jgi:hypothetical protein